MLFQGTTEQEGGQRTLNICELPCTGQGKMEMMEIEKTEIVAAILLVGFFFTHHILLLYYYVRNKQYYKGDNERGQANINMCGHVALVW